MNDEQLLERIVVNREVMVAKPVIRGTRLTVEHVLGLLAHGATIEDILKEYEGLTPEDVRACLVFAQKCLGDTAYMPLPAEAA